MTDYAIPVVWANYPITTSSGPVGGLGHAGVVIVNGTTGHTRYFEYGRYDTDSSDNPIGAVQSRSISNLTINNGVIDGTSLQNMITNLNGSAGKGTPATGTILPLGEGGYDAALAYALQAQNDSSGTLGEYSWANDNHCYTFAKAVAAAGGSWVDWFDGFGPFDNVPSSAMITLIANKGGFFIGGPQGDLLLGGASSYATDINFDNCFLAGTMITMADGSKKPIEQIRPDDWVLSMDHKTGQMVPSKVTRTFQNEAKIVLDFHGTFVTPGHVYYRPDSKRASKFEPLIDILRDDGIIQHQDGTLIRATTGCEVGSEDDQEFWAFTIDQVDGGEKVRDKKKLRFGTRWMLPNGNHFSMREYMEGMGVEIIKDGPHAGYARWKETGITSVFAWVLSDTLPNPEDFVLARSQTTLEDIYRAADWESVRPSMPAPMIMDGGPVQPLSGDRLDQMPRNEPLAMQGNTPSSTLLPDRNPQMNRRQRKAMEAKLRKAQKNKRPKGSTLH